MSFKFHQHALYEQVTAYAKDVYQITSKLPDYEHLGLINHIRDLCTQLVENTAVTLTYPKLADVELGLKQGIILVSKIAADFDLAHSLKYIDQNTHDRAIALSEDITKNLHATKDGK